MVKAYKKQLKDKDGNYVYPVVPGVVRTLDEQTAATPGAWVTPDMVNWNQPRVDSVGDMGDTITTIRFENGIQMTFRTYSFYNHSITTAWGQMFHGPINDTIRIAPNDLPFIRVPTVTVTPFGTVEGSGAFMVGAYNTIPGSTNVTYLPANTFTLTRGTQASAVSGKLAVTAIGMWK